MKEIENMFETELQIRPIVIFSQDPKEEFGNTPGFFKHPLAKEALQRIGLTLFLISRKGDKNE